MKICSPEGRDCIENNSTSTFNCSFACEGIYADVEWVENVVEGMEGKKRDGLDRQKFKKLISEYNHFKKNQVQHFRFDSAARSASFGNSIVSNKDQIQNR